jgi:integrase
MKKEKKDLLVDLYQFKEKFDSAVERLRASGAVSRKDKELILSYVAGRGTRRGELSLPRREKLVRYLRIMRETLGKDFDRATGEDLNALMEKLKNRPVVMLVRRSDEKGKTFFEEKVTDHRIGSWTHRDYAVILKGFYAWLKDTKDPEETRRIYAPKPLAEELTQDRIISWDDVLKMSGVCQSPRDRALIQTLWDSGLRIGELLTLRVGDVEVLNDGQAVILHLRESKTRIRNPVIGFAGPAMVDWLECHPHKDDTKAPLWVDFQHDRQWGYDAVRRMLRKIARRAGIEKNVNPHAFRKSSASVWGHHLTDSELENRFGWVQGSGMKRIYCFPDEDRVNNKVLQVAGIEDVPKTNGDIVEEQKPHTCLWCNTINPAGRKKCTKCRRSLNPIESPLKVSKDEEKQALIAEIMQALEAKFGEKIGRMATIC